METFIDLLKSSVLVQGVITLVIVVTLCITVINQTPLPTYFTDITLLVIGFWFGSKIQSILSRSR